MTGTLWAFPTFPHRLPVRGHDLVPTGSEPASWSVGLSPDPAFARERTRPMKNIVLWMLGVPVTVIVLLNLFGFM